MLMQPIDGLLQKYAYNFCLKSIEVEILFSPIGFPHPLNSILSIKVSIKRKKKTLQTIIIEPIPIKSTKTES